MSYTITNRYTGEPIYVAEGAADVREAVEQAAKERAYLADAYLARANLAGAYLARANLARANLAGANLAGANLADAYLARANLTDAYLADANLADANLTDANLTDAYLADANLADANLARAKGLHPARVNDLLILLDQPGKIRAYKLTTAEGNGPTYAGLAYEVGKTLEVAKPNTDPNLNCGAGVNLATLPWVLRHWHPGYRIFLCEFTRSDIAAIPISGGKFRVSKAKVVKEVPEKQIHEWLGIA